MNISYPHQHSVQYQPIGIGELKHLEGEASNHPPEVAVRLAWFRHYVSGGCASETCRAFGIARSTFYRWWKRFDPGNLASLRDLPAIVPPAVRRMQGLPGVSAGHLPRPANGGSGRPCEPSEASVFVAHGFCALCRLKSFTWTSLRSAVLVTSIVFNLALASLIVFTAMLEGQPTSAASTAPPTILPGFEDNTETSLHPPVVSGQWAVASRHQTTHGGQSESFTDRFLLPTVHSLLGIEIASAAAGIYRPINYQGKLTNSGGVAIANGTYDLRFRIYSAASGGTPLWTETWNASSQKVTATGGLFSIALGTHTAMTGSVNFNSDSLFLQVEFDPGTDGVFEEVFTPRRRFASVPYAHNADSLDGLNSTHFIRSDVSYTASGTLTISPRDTSKVGIDILSTAGSGNIAALKLSTQGANHILFGTGAANYDTNLYRGAANLLRTDDSFYVVGTLSGGIVRADILLTSSGRLLVESGAQIGGSTFVVDSGNGRVGIGTTAPDSTLHVKSADSPQFKIQMSDTAADSAAALVFTNSTADSLEHAAIKSLRVGTNAADLTFSVANGAAQYASLVERMRILSNGNIGVGTTAPTATLEVAGIISGSTLHVLGTASGQNLFATRSISGTHLYAATTFGGAGLADCDTSATSKLLWDSATKRFYCGTDQTGGSAGTASFSGAVLQLGDARYVKKSGDTMTGALVINSNGGYANTALLEVLGTMSGRSLYVTGTGSSPLLYTDISTGRVGIGTISPTSQLHLRSAAGMQGGVAIEYPGGTTFRLYNDSQYASYDVGVGHRFYVNGSVRAILSSSAMTFVPSVLPNTANSADLGSPTAYWRTVYVAGANIVGTASGRTLHAQDLLRSSGALVVEGNATFHGTMENGLAGWWAMDSSSGVYLVDSSVNTNSGQLVNGAALTTGKFGKGISFDGTDDYFVASSMVPNPKLLTASLWFYPRRSNAQESLLFQHRNATASAWDIQWFNGVLSGNVRTTGSVGASAGAVPVNHWSHVVMTYDGAQITMYVNGRLAGTAAQSGDIANPASPGFIVGGRGNIDKMFSGIIDDVRIYDRALSEREIADLYRWNSQSIGGSMSGQVIIAGSSNFPLLSILGTASGRVLHAQDLLRSSGSLVVQTTGLFKGNLTTRGTLSGAALTVMNGASYFLGNVGIGTTSPTARLTIQDAGAGIVNIGQVSGNSTFAGIAFSQTNSAQISVANYSLLGNGTDTILNRPTGGNIDFRENNTTQMRLNAGGQLTIGTGGDSSGLASNSLIVTNAGTTSLSVRDSTNDVELFNYVSSVGGLIGTFTNHTLTIRTNNADRMTFDTSGNVGIGTTAPKTKLDVVGTISGKTLAVSGNGSFSGSLVVAKSISGAALEILGTASGRVLHAQDLLRSSGALVVEGAVTFAGLPSCTSLATASDGALSCGSALSQTNADARYVKKSGDTMTGALTINLTSGTVGLKILQTLSGSTIKADRVLSSSGYLVVDGTTVLTATGAAQVPLVVMGASAQSSSLQEWRNSAGTAVMKIDKNGHIYGNVNTFNVRNNTSGMRIGDTNATIFFDNTSIWIEDHALPSAYTGLQLGSAIGTYERGWDHILVQQVKAPDPHQEQNVAARNLVLRGSNAGVISTGSNQNGGLVYIYGGSPVSTASTGSVILAHNGTSPRGYVGIRTLAPETSLEVLGTISGSTLTVSGNGSFSGSLRVARAISGATLEILGTMSGRSLVVSGTGALPLMDASAAKGRVDINATIENGLVGWWPMDTASGGYVSDLSLNGNNGAVTGPVLAAGKIGKTLEFDGVDDFVDLGTVPALNITKPMTVSAWIRGDSFLTPNSSAIVSNGNNATNYSLEVQTSSKKVWINWGDTYLFTGNTVLQPGQWYHVVLTRSGTTGSWTGILYVNGVEDGRIATATNPSGTSVVTRIGDRQNKNRFFDGLIDDVRIYNRALSEREVAELFRWGSQSLGGTMSGQIIIAGNPNTPLLSILGTASGRVLHAQDLLRSSGSLVVQTTGLFKGNLTTRGTLSGAALTVMNGTSFFMGNVGIGTTSPGVKLDISQGIFNSNGNDTKGITVSGDAAGNRGFLGMKISLLNSSSNYTGYIRAARTVGTTYIGMELISETSHGIRFLTSGATDANERMRISSTGNVGIGTTSPGSRLSVSGAIIISPNGNLGSAAADSGLALEILGTASGRVLHAQDLLTSSGGLVVEQSAIRGDAALVVNQHAYFGTGALIRQSRTGSGAPLLVLDAYTRSGARTPHILFGYRGTFDVRAYRASSGSLTIESTTGTTLQVHSHMTGSTNVFSVASDEGGEENTVFRVRADGEAFADGSFTGGGADYAERFLSSTPDLASGEAVCLDVLRSNTVKRCDRSGDANVMGIVSTKPAFVGDKYQSGGSSLVTETTAVVGLIGQLPAKAIVEDGMAIAVGDAVTSAAKPGFVRKSKPGESTVGVALSPLQSGEGVIEVLITRRNQSDLVEKIENEVTRSIADMHIEDDVRQMVQSAMDGADINAAVAAAVNSQVQNLNLIAQMNAVIDQRLADGSLLINSTGSLATDIFAVLRTQTGATAVQDSVSARLGLSRTGTAALVAGSDLLVAGALTVQSDVLVGGTLHAAAIAGPVRFDGPILPGADFAVGSLSFSGSAVQIGSLTQSGTLQVVGDVTIGGLATFLGTVKVKGELVVSDRHAGYALIPRHGRSVTILFGTGFTATPVVTASPNGFVRSPWRVGPVTQTGFTVELAEPAPEELMFSWLALATEIPVVHAAAADPIPSIPFHVDAEGRPLSVTDNVWNACIRDPYSFDVCRGYHQDSQWFFHPDIVQANLEVLSFTYDPSAGPSSLVLPASYEALVGLPPAVSSSAGSSEQSSSPGVPGEPVNSSSGSTVSSPAEHPASSGESGSASSEPSSSVNSSAAGDERSFASSASSESSEPSNTGPSEAAGQPVPSEAASSTQGDSSESGGTGPGSVETGGSEAQQAGAEVGG